MAARVWQCTSFDTATATCTQAAWVEQSTFPSLSVAEAGQLLGAIALVFATAWAWKHLPRYVRQ